MFSLLNTFLEDAQTRKAWQKNTLEGTFTSSAGEDQGSITSLAPHGYQGLVHRTMFNRTTSLPIPGGLDAAEWQFKKALTFSGPFHQYRLRGDRLLFEPALPAGQAIYFEYYSNYFVREGSTPKMYFSKDEDTCTYPDPILLAWINWRWKAEKGFEYAEDFRAYEMLISVYTIRDDSPDVIHLDAEVRDPRPGIIVPPGNWPLM
jgi:hypothetical protein